MDLGVGNAVDLLGERHDIPAILAAIDVFASSSTTEGLPITVLEAMAARLPVVATRVGAVSTVVDHEKTGYLVPPRSSAVLATSLVEVLQQ